MKERHLKFKRILSLFLVCCCVLTMNFGVVFAQTTNNDRIRIPFNDERVTYSEGWNNWQDMQMFTNTVGSTVTVEFSGTGFSILGGLAKNGPIATVDIDGVVEEADFFKANGTGAEGKVYEKRGLEDKEHTAVITFTDKVNPQYGGGFAHLQIAVYAFEELHYADVRRIVTVNGGTANVEDALAGDEVEITADEPNEGERFVKWETKDVALVDEFAKSTSFVMPDNDVTVQAVFEKKRTEPMTFYVDSADGNDDADGTSSETAWKTIDKLNGMEFIGGDKILLKAGSVFEDQALSIQGEGSRENPIIVDMYDDTVVGAEAGKRPHIKGNGNNSFIYQGNTISYGLHIKNASHVQVNNVEISNQGPERKLSVGVCVEAAGCGVMQGVYINNVYIHDVNGTYLEKTLPNGGLYYVVSDHSNDTRFDDIKVENCSVKRVSRTGISVGSSSSYALWDGHKGYIPQEVLDAYGHTNVLIKNNYVEEAGGDAIVPQFCIKPVIEYNISNGASQNTRHTSMYNAGIWPWRCEDAVFQFNECYGTVINGDGQAYDCDWSRGTVYQYNYSHDNEGGFILVCQSEALESVVRYNVSQNDMDSLFLTSNPNNADIYNNTFYIGEGLNTNIADDWGGKITLKNNIFYNAGDRKAPSWGGYTYENNLYYGFDTTPDDSKKIIGDPMFAAANEGGTGVEGDSAIDTLGGYNLQADSPAIDKGLAIENNGGRDYEGKLLSEENVDLGAFERVESAEDEHTVTVVNGEGSGNYVYNTKLTIKAPLISEDNKAFAGWKVDDKIVSTDAEYTFYVAGDVTFTAIYQEEATEKEAQALLSNVLTTMREDEKLNVRFVGQIVVPDGWEIAEAGLVWSTKDTPLIVDGALNPKLNPTYIRTISETNQFSVTIKGMPSHLTLRGQIFAKLVDGEGNSQYIFSDEGTSSNAK